MPSWGRHGWPKKNELARLYRERKGDYLIVFVAPENILHNGNYEAVANVYEEPEPPSLASTSVGRNYTYDKGCRRVQWSELPQHWQQAFRRWLCVEPEKIRGFWLAKNIQGE